jgi:hypothetical protein
MCEAKLWQYQRLLVRSMNSLRLVHSSPAR